MAAQQPEIVDEAGKVKRDLTRTKDEDDDGSDAIGTSNARLAQTSDEDVGPGGDAQPLAAAMTRNEAFATPVPALAIVTAAIDIEVHPRQTSAGPVRALAASRRRVPAWTNLELRVIERMAAARAGASQMANTRSAGKKVRNVSKSPTSLV